MHATLTLRAVLGLASQRPLPVCPNVAPVLGHTDILNSEHMPAGMYLPLSILVTSLPTQAFG